MIFFFLFWKNQGEKRQDKREKADDWLVGRQDQTRVVSLQEEEEIRRTTLLSWDLPGLELGNKVFDCLLLEVGAHVAGEGTIRMALACITARKNKTKNTKLIR